MSGRFAHADGGNFYCIHIHDKAKCTRPPGGFGLNGGRTQKLLANCFKSKRLGGRAALQHTGRTGEKPETRPSTPIRVIPPTRRLP